jgi:hypothetical protein
MSICERLKSGAQTLLNGRYPAAIGAALLCTASTAFAHGERPGHIDEGPGLPVWITIITVVSWIVTAVAVVFFVLRLVRRRGPGNRGDKSEEA